MKAFLVDDEQLSLDRLTLMLGRFNDIAIVGTAANGRDALHAIPDANPDVVFLDVEMPACDGLELAEELVRQSAKAPIIVFVTAFPRFAVEAFDQGALDFLTKPVRFERLEKCVKRARNALHDRSAQLRHDDLLRQIEKLRAAEDSKGNFLWIYRRKEAVRVNLNHVDRVIGEGEYVRLFVDGRDYLHRESMTSMAAKLPKGRFMRIHRSHIVRLDRIASVRRGAAGGYSLVLDNGVTVPVGRSYRSSLLSLQRTAGDNDEGGRSAVN